MTAYKRIRAEYKIEQHERTVHPIDKDIGMKGGLLVV